MSGPSQKADFLPPTGPDPTDASPIMQEKHSRRFEDPREALEALLHWDELEREELAALEADPRHAASLKTLRSLQGWMDQRIASPRPGLGPCPAAEELYDYGRGVGAQALAPERRTTLDQHVRRCPACEQAIEVLATRPPAVVISTHEASLPLSSPQRAAVPQPARIEEVEARRARSPRSQAFWGPLMALAASLLAALALWTLVADEGAQHLPAAPTLRGGSQGMLLFPRGKVLADREALGASALPLRLELAPLSGAQAWRVELVRHTGGAFDAGEPVAEYRGSATELLIEDALGAGHYTARVFATIAGLERETGAQDFELRHDPDLTLAIRSTRGASELERTRALVRLLHENGYLTDARELARTLPADEERERYLATGAAAAPESR
jgi:hypothetical protein